MLQSTNKMILNNIFSHYIHQEIYESEIDEAKIYLKSIVTKLEEEKKIFEDLNDLIASLHLGENFEETLN